MQSQYRPTSLYEIAKDRKICLVYKEFAYEKTKDDCRSEDRFYKNIILNRIYPNSQIKRPQITRSACTYYWHNASHFFFCFSAIHLFPSLGIVGNSPIQLSQPFLSFHLSSFLLWGSNLLMIRNSWSLVLFSV